ncbi:MAG: serpin family protein [Thermoguttaceae bacterium]
MAVRSFLVVGGIVALVFAGPLACSKNEGRNDNERNRTSAAIKPDKEFAVVPFVRLNDDQKREMSTVVQGNNEFAADLYSRLKDKTAGNLFFSPYSISAALAMTYAGAASETQKQMAEVLHFTVSRTGTPRGHGSPP